MRDEALMRFGYAVASGTWALLVIAALALLCSVIFDSPVQAIVITIAAYLTLYIVGRVFCKCWVWRISGGDSLSLLL
jgi:hypothetical protein